MCWQCRTWKGQPQKVQDETSNPDLLEKARSWSPVFALTRETEGKHLSGPCKRQCSLRNRNQWNVPRSGPEKNKRPPAWSCTALSRDDLFCCYLARLTDHFAFFRSLKLQSVVFWTHCHQFYIGPSCKPVQDRPLPIIKILQMVKKCL